MFRYIQACNHESLLGQYDDVDEPGFSVLTANRILETHWDHLLQWDGACHARRTARWRRTLRLACRCERVDTCWLALLVTLACSNFRLHISALRCLVPLLLAVHAFTLKLSDQFLMSFLALPPFLDLPLPPLSPLPLSDRGLLPPPCRS